MKISEIFKSIEGEGVRAGLPCTFIRLYGCNLRCSYCDSMYAVEGNEFKEMTVTEIAYEVYKLEIKAVTITGGEPLLAGYEFIQLLEMLVEQGCEINIETNGSIKLTDVIKVRKRNPKSKITITMDWKSVSSNESSKNLLMNLTLLDKRDVLKFVVKDRTDLCQMEWLIKDTIRPFLNSNNISIFVSPVFGEIEYKDIVEFILEKRLYEVRFQLQLHKFIWEPNARGV